MNREARLHLPKPSMHQKWGEVVLLLSCKPSSAQPPQLAHGQFPVYSPMLVVILYGTLQPLRSGQNSVARTESSTAKSQANSGSSPCR